MRCFLYLKPELHLIQRLVKNKSSKYMIYSTALYNHKVRRQAHDCGIFQYIPLLENFLCLHFSKIQIKPNIEHTR